MKRYTPGLEVGGPTWAASRRIVMDEVGDGEWVLFVDVDAELARLRAEQEVLKRDRALLEAWMDAMGCTREGLLKIFGKIVDAAPTGDK